jgi:hypothetical protein
VSRHRKDFDLQLPLGESLKACQVALLNIGWSFERKPDKAFITAWEPQKLLSTAWAVKTTIYLKPNPDGSTRITIEGSNFGFGPVQKAHLKQQVNLLANYVEQAVGTSSSPTEGPHSTETHRYDFSYDLLGRLKGLAGNLANTQHPDSLSSELERLADLHNKGILTDEEFQKAKSRLISG